MASRKQNEIESANILRGIGKQQSEIEQKLSKDAVDGVFVKTKRHPDTVNDRELIVVVVADNFSAFFQEWAKAFCAPLQLDGLSQEFNECVLVNSTTEQGAPLYDINGAIGGKILRMPATRKIEQRLKDGCGKLAFFLDNESQLDNRLKQLGLTLVDPIEKGIP